MVVPRFTTRVDGAMDARWSEDAQIIVCTEKMHNFIMVIIVSRTYHISYKRISNEYWNVENVFLKHILFLIFGNKGEKTLILGWNFENVTV